MFAIVASTGLRPEELLSLQCGDISFADSSLTVRCSLSWVRGQGESGRVRAKFFEPKPNRATGQSRRRLNWLPCSSAGSYRRRNRRWTLLLRWVWPAATALGRAAAGPLSRITARRTAEGERENIAAYVRFVLTGSRPAYHASSATLWAIRTRRLRCGFTATGSRTRTRRA